MLYSLFYMPFVCHSYVLIWHSCVICMYLYVIRMSLGFTPLNRPVFCIRTIVKPNWNKTCNNKKNLVCHKYITHMYSYAIRMSLVYTRTASSLVCHPHVLVCHPYVLVCHPYVTHMPSVCTCMSSICHSYVLVCTCLSSMCHSYAIRMYSHVTRISLVCSRMSPVCTRMSFVCHSSVVLPWTLFFMIYILSKYIFSKYTYSIIINLYSIRNISWSIFFSVK